MPNEAFIHIEIQNPWAWADKLGKVSPLSMFSIIQPLFLQKTKPLFPYPKYFLGLGFEFGPQRIRDLAFVSVVRVTNDASSIFSRQLAQLFFFCFDCLINVTTLLNFSIPLLRLGKNNLQGLP